MSAVQSAVRHVLGLVLLAGLGLVAGGLFAGPAAGQSGCGLQSCAIDPGEEEHTYICEFSYNDWGCSWAGGVCTTQGCGDGGPCQFECQT
jgi:hypothetical protein